MKKNKKIVGIIPAHLNSIRFPNKILYLINGIPMIEHVRRRALLSQKLNKVIVATCDEEISDCIKGFCGEVIMTSSLHNNGTSRVAEVSKKIDCTHVVLIQGDEPLILPSSIDKICDEIEKDTDSLMWNATGPINSEDELTKHSFVKCAVNKNKLILYMFRNNPSFAKFEIKKQYIRKILGLIAFNKSFLQKFVNYEPTFIEENEFIEQMRAVEHGHLIKSVNLEKSTPSVNEPGEVELVIDLLNNDDEQKELFKKVQGF